MRRYFGIAHNDTRYGYLSAKDWFYQLSYRGDEKEAGGTEGRERREARANIEISAHSVFSKFGFSGGPHVSDGRPLTPVAILMDPFGVVPDVYSNDKLSSRNIKVDNSLPIWATSSPANLRGRRNSSYIDDTAYMMPAMTIFKYAKNIINYGIKQKWITLNKKIAAPRSATGTVNKRIETLTRDGNLGINILGTFESQSIWANIDARSIIRQSSRWGAD